MEPSFWSWEKIIITIEAEDLAQGRNGAQLLELGKVGHHLGVHHGMAESQWSPAFGAGKRATPTR